MPEKSYVFYFEDIRTLQKNKLKNCGCDLLFNSGNCCLIPFFCLLGFLRFSCLAGHRELTDEYISLLSFFDLWLICSTLNFGFVFCCY